MTRPRTGFLPASFLLLAALRPGALAAAGDLDVGWISRSPRIDFVWGSSNPAREGWPAEGERVTWEAHVRGWVGQDLQDVGYRFVLDGAEVARGTVDVAAGSTVVVGFPWTWTFQRHELVFEIDPEGRVAEDEEGNNRLSVFTDALSVGFYVEQSLYDHFRANQRRLAGARSNSFEDWAQRPIRRFNEMAARAVYAATPLGVLDRFRLDEVVVVPDGALPLVPLDGLNQSDADGHTHPNLADRSVDLLWGFEASDVHVYSDLTTVSDLNNFFLQGALIHELGHARYLIDVYGWWVRDGVNGDRVDITENGVRVAGSPLMPASGPMLHLASEQGLMNQTYGFVDRFSAAALNLIAGRRATTGNYNVPENRGAFLNDLPAENRVTIRDAAGTPIPDADVFIYQAASGGPYFFSKVYDDVPDLRLRTDAQGRVLVGRCPFSPDGRIVHGFGGSNATAIVRVAKGGFVAYGFLESLTFNVAYWEGHRELAEHELVAGRECFINAPFLAAPKPEATLSSSPVALSWEPVFGATGYEVWASADGEAPRLLGTTPAGKLSLTANLTGRVAWWVVASFAACASRRSGIGHFRVLPLASFEYAPATPRPGEPVSFFGHAEGGAASFAWSFGDGGTASIAEPSHVFAAEGSFPVTLTVTTPSGAHTARRTITVAHPAPPTFTTTLFVPLVLSAHGRAGSFFTSEMALTNRGTTGARVRFRYTDWDGAVGAGEAEDLVPAGRQIVHFDAIAYLKAKGLALPEGDRVGTLRLTFEGLSVETAAAVTLRSTTPVPGGRAGLAYRALRSTELLTGRASLCGLRQDEADRSNVAVQNAGAPGDGSITLRLTARSSDGVQTAVIGEQTLAPGRFFQIAGALESLGPNASGCVTVERLAGAAPFFAYGVVNDQVTSDGSFVPPLEESAAPVAGWVVPVVVETPVFSTELVVANLTAAPRTVRLALGPRGEAGEVTLLVPLAPFEQRLIPDVVDHLRAHGTGTLEPRGSAVAAPLFVNGVDGDARGLFAGARVTSAAAGGRMGIFVNAVAAEEAATDAVWLHSLRQDAESRTNVAFVGAGEIGGTPNVFDVDVFDGDTGARVAALPAAVTVGPRGLVQLNALLAQLAPGTTNGYARLRRSAGASPFLAFAVVNDGASPGERSGDGAFLLGAAE